MIWLFERAGWVHDVRWPDGQRIRARLLPELALSANLPDRQDEGGTGQGQQRSEGEEQRVA